MEDQITKWDEPEIRAYFAKSADVHIHLHTLGDPPVLRKVLLIYCSGMADIKQINQYMLPALDRLLKDPELDVRSEEIVRRQLDLLFIPAQRFEEAVTLVYSGHLVLFFTAEQVMYSLDIANPPRRSPEESSTEVSIKGPRDAFTEELDSNVALVRKRLRTNSMCNERFVIGSRSNTNVSLLYLGDVVRPEIIEEARKRLQNLQLDSLIGSGQLEELLVDSKYPIFPMFDYIGRPDFIADSLVRGRFSILVDGSPMALIGPTNLTVTLKSPEDMYLPFYFVALERLLRMFGLLVSILLPGFWVAVSSFNMDQIPFPLLATIVSSKLGLPLSGAVDFYFMLALFELFREAGLRLPRAVGQTVAVVGGLIVGDAAIRAGITSPTTLVVSAITAVSSFTLVNQSLNGTVTVLRIFVLTFASLLGMYGFFISVFAIILYLSTQRSFGVPYLAPLSPPNYREWIPALLAKPLKLQKKRPDFLHTKDPNR
jgi:hypothetical protein